MRKLVTILAAVVWTGAIGLSADHHVQTVKGEVVDVQCQMKDAKNKGGEHADCAMSCAKRGAAMGILTDKGVYTITGDMTKDKNAKLIEFVSKKVEATGAVSEKDGKSTIDVTTMKLAM
jgi:hypothetical protein